MTVNNKGSEAAARGLARTRNLWQPPGLPLVHAQDEGTQALARHVESENAKPPEATPEHASMAQAAEDTAEAVRRAATFLFHFVRIPNLAALISQPYSATPRTAWAEWLHDSLIPDGLPLRKLRDWLEGNLPTHATYFERRVWDPWHRYIDAITQHIETPWPEAEGAARQFSEIADFLKTLAGSIREHEELQKANRPVNSVGKGRGEPLPLADLLRMAGLNGPDAARKPKGLLLANLRSKPDEWQAVFALNGVRRGEAHTDAKRQLHELKALGITEIEPAKAKAKAKWRLSALAFPGKGETKGETTAP